MPTNWLMASAGCANANWVGTVLAPAPMMPSSQLIAARIEQTFGWVVEQGMRLEIQQELAAEGVSSARDACGEAGVVSLHDACGGRGTDPEGLGPVLGPYCDFQML